MILDSQIIPTHCQLETMIKYDLRLTDIKENYEDGSILVIGKCNNYVIDRDGSFYIEK